MPPIHLNLARIRPRPVAIGMVAIAAAAALGAGVSWVGRGLGPAAPVATVEVLPQSELPTLTRRAFQQASLRQPGQSAAFAPLQIRSGETFTAALQRIGVARDEARTAVQALSSGMDVTHLRAGQTVQADLAGGRLVGLALRTGPATVLSLSRDASGAFHLRQFAEKVTQETTVAQGTLTDSLYLAAVRAGADARLVAEAVKLYSHKIDFSRDIHPDDHFKLVFDRKVAESGRTIETGGLAYAELEAKGKVTRFYRFHHDGRDEFFDENGKNIRGFLLRTPLDAVRVTSGFGLRFHPVLGYTRMHEGIDFGASSGTPVFAAGDGVVQEMRWANGYGRWLKIRHMGGWATGYGHLSAYARGLRAGQHVAQGQVVAYVGMTGIATGPHLHYEVMDNNRKLDPKGAKVPQGAVLGGRELAAFRLAKARVDALIAEATHGPHPVQTASLQLRSRPGGGSL